MGVKGAYDNFKVKYKGDVLAFDAENGTYEFYFEDADIVKAVLGVGVRDREIGGETMQVAAVTGFGKDEELKIVEQGYSMSIFSGKFARRISPNSKELKEASDLADSEFTPQERCRLSTIFDKVDKRVIEHLYQVVKDIQGGGVTADTAFEAISLLWKYEVSLDHWQDILTKMGY